MIVYVAGASAEIDRARRVMAALRERGIEVAHDWPAVIDAHDGRANTGLSERERVAAALACLEGIDRCDVLLLLMPNAATMGAFVELGYAFALRFPGGPPGCVIASGWARDCQRTIMLALADEVSAEDTTRDDWSIAAAQQRADDRAIAWLVERAREAG